MLGEEALQCSLLVFVGWPTGLTWWISPALSNCSWERGTQQLPLPQLLYLSAETEGPEEIASVAPHSEVFDLCY